MATKIRLQRHGKKRAAFYHVVIADERAKRDGRFIEKIGTYNPNTDPAIIDLKFDRALHWLQLGAVPTDTARAILSYKGVMLKNHLDKGVVKGAITEAEAEKKFEAWMKEKETKIAGKTDSVEKEKASVTAEKMKKETEQKEARSAAIAARELAIEEAPAEAATEEAPAAEGDDAPAAEAATEEAPAAEAATDEAPAAEKAKEEAPAAEKAKEEAPAAEKAKEEAPAAEEAKEEAPAAEEAKEEAPAAEKGKEDKPAAEAKDAPAE